MAALYNIWLIVSKPDNIPIAGMLVVTIFFGWLAFRLALRNDRLRIKAGQGAAPASLAQWGGALMEIPPQEAQSLNKKVHTWPHLVRIEFLAAIWITVLLFVWSVYVDAPLEEPANPNFSPNPAKAPWYFLGLQDLLVYFDPWIAGVVIPFFIIFGLMVIPYVLPAEGKTVGAYSYADRKLEIWTFSFGFFILWVLLIIIGTFLRGPGWIWFWPWQEWDPHRVVSETNVNLNEWLAMLTGLKFFKNDIVGFLLGALTVFGFYAVGMVVPYIKIVRFRRVGPVRWGIISFFFWTMMGIPIKIILRLLFHIKYIWVTPYFNI